MSPFFLFVSAFDFPVGLFGQCDCVRIDCYRIVYSENVSRSDNTIVGSIGHKLHTSNTNLSQLGGKIVGRFGNVHWSCWTHFIAYQFIGWQEHQLQQWHWWNSLWTDGNKANGKVWVIFRSKSCVHACDFSCVSHFSMCILVLVFVMMCVCHDDPIVLIDLFWTFWHNKFWANFPLWQCVSTVYTLQFVYSMK